jgi:hypothetical protein
MGTSTSLGAFDETVHGTATFMSAPEQADSLGHLGRGDSHDVGEA